MRRRSFLFRCLAAIAGWSVVEPIAARENHYYFDWTTFGKPHTDDPKHVGKLVHGLHNRVYLNGVDVGAVTRFLTGSNGWVERFKLDDAGNYIIIDDDIVRETLYGRVEYVDLSN